MSRISTDLAIALIDPKYPHNVGGAIRAASCYGASHLFYTGQRMHDQVIALPRLPREERMKGYRDVDWRREDNALDLIGRDVTPVAVEYRHNAESLFDFVHPRKALYIFGPEDGNVPGAVLARCHRFVVVPTAHCMNLSAAVNVVLYDRAAKAHRGGLAYGIDEESLDRRQLEFSL
ncbi:MAG: TrmH family RNA methyltransferase [Capsulimonadaceae bacterium]